MTKGSPIRILIAEDHPIVRDGLKKLLSLEEDFEVVGEAADGCEVLFASYPAGTVIAGHSHETDNVGVITVGELILMVDGRETRYGAGEWDEVPRGTTHSARFEVATAEIELWFRSDGEEQ